MSELNSPTVLTFCDWGPHLASRAFPPHLNPVVLGAWKLARVRSKVDVLGATATRGAWARKSWHLGFECWLLGTSWTRGPARRLRATQGPSWGYSKVNLQQTCQFLTTNFRKMAPRTRKRLSRERGQFSERATFEERVQLSQMWPSSVKKGERATFEESNFGLKRASFEDRRQHSEIEDNFRSEGNFRR